MGNKLKTEVQSPSPPVTPADIVKVTQHAAQWSYGSNFFKLNQWLKYVPRVYLELLVKYYSRNLARTPIKTHKGGEKWPLFVNKQLFWWSASITLDNNNAFLTDL